MGTAAEPAGEFTHPALCYRAEQDYLAGLVPFITDGLAGAEPVAVAVPGPKPRLLRTALDGSADQVRMIETTEAGGNPGRIINGVLRRFADAHRDTHVGSSASRSGPAARTPSTRRARSTRR